MIYLSLHAGFCGILWPGYQYLSAARRGVVEMIAIVFILRGFRIFQQQVQVWLTEQICLILQSDFLCIPQLYEESQLVGALSPVNHRGLHQGRLRRDVVIWGLLWFCLQVSLVLCGRALQSGLCGLCRILLAGIAFRLVQHYAFGVAFRLVKHSAGGHIAFRLFFFFCILWAGISTYQQQVEVWVHNGLLNSVFRYFVAFCRQSFSNRQWYEVVCLNRLL